MMYQMADNNLQYYIRQDYEELTKSRLLVKTDEIRVWVYFDALNDDGGTVLPNTLTASGAAVSAKFSGSRYVTYDGQMGKMRIDKEFPTEQNSDGSAPVQAFLEYALADCLADGFDSLMASFASHGGGFAGFGGDENTERLRRRLRASNATTAGRALLTSNTDIALAIQNALSNTDGAPDKLDVLGFDACLMQGVGAADDYLGVTKYILASEAVEPGHGWAYEALTEAPTALDLARNILNSFIDETHGGRSHKTPKQLSIVDTEKFQSTFVDAFNEFSGELLRLLESGDQSLHAFVSRSRASAVAFESIVDSVGTNNPSALDVGSWLRGFQELCAPGGDLGPFLQNIIDAYDGMMVLQRVGEGTAAGTGMHISWPEQGEYNTNAGLWDQVLFDNEAFKTQIVPNFTAFLKWFLTSGSPSTTAEDEENNNSICGQGAGINAESREDGTLDLITYASAALDVETGFFEVNASISLDVTQMLLEYGIDLSGPFEDLLIEKGFQPEPEDHLFLLGGDVAGQYERTNYSAAWDENFYFLNISGVGNFEALYVKDEGDGSKQIPLLYFPEDQKEKLGEIQYLDYLFFDYGFWSEKGARYGFWKFSVDAAEGRANDNLALYVVQSGVLAEMPPSAGGIILPLVQIDANVQGRQLSTLPGGFNQTAVVWSSELDYNVLTTPARNIYDVIPDAGQVIMALYALSAGNSEVEPDVRYFNVTISEAPPTQPPTNPPTSPPTDPPTESPVDLSESQSVGGTGSTNSSGITPSSTEEGNSAPTLESSPVDTEMADNSLNQTIAPRGNTTAAPTSDSALLATQKPGNIFDHDGSGNGTVTDDSDPTSGSALELQKPGNIVDHDGSGNGTVTNDSDETESESLTPAPSSIMATNKETTNAALSSATTKPLPGFLVAVIIGTILVLG